MPSFRGSFPVLCLLLVSLIGSVSAACNSSEYECATLKCVPQSKRFDGFNDCEDNTDEVQARCPKVNTFHCLNGDCQKMSYWLDGVGDCSPNHEDEWKKIGNRCIMGAATLFPCNSTVDNSICDNSTCRCDDGYQATNDNRNCTLRVLGDQCQSTVDCSAAVANALCDASRCACAAHYVTTGRAACLRRNLTDACVQSAQCSFFIPNAACINSTCNCPPGFATDTAAQTCTRRVVGSSCGVEFDCSAAMGNSTCSASFVCACNEVFYATPDRTACTLRLLGEACAHDRMCFGVAHARCTDGINNNDSGNGTCECAPGYYQTSAAACVGRRINESCAVAQDCSLGLPGGLCPLVGGQRVCRCAAAYQPNAPAGDRCDGRVLGDTCARTSDCATVEHAQCVGGVCTCPGTEVGNSTCLYSGESTSSSGFPIWIIAIIALFPIGIIVALVVKLIYDKKKKKEQVAPDRYLKPETPCPPAQVDCPSRGDIAI